MRSSALAVDAVGRPGAARAAFAADLCGVHAPPTPAARPAAGAGPAGGRRPRRRWRGGRSLCRGGDARRGSRYVRTGARRPPASPSQARRIESPSTLIVFAGSGDFAGPAVTAPSAIANLLLVAGADDRAVGHRVDLAALVGAGRRERLEVAGRRLGDDHVLVGEDRAAADRDVGGGGQLGTAGARRGRRGRRCRRRRPRRWPRAPSPSSRRRRRSAVRRRRPRRRRRRPRAGSGRAPGSEAAAGGWDVGWVMKVLAWWWERCAVGNGSRAGRFTGAHGVILAVR